MAVASGKIDVATNNTESIYARLAEANPEAAASIKEIWRPPLIPSDPMVWRKALPADAKQKIYYFFMPYGRFGDPEQVQRERKILAEMSDCWWPFFPSSNPHLPDVRKITPFKAPGAEHSANNAKGPQRSEQGQ